MEGEGEERRGGEGGRRRGEEGRGGRVTVRGGGAGRGRGTGKVFFSDGYLRSPVIMVPLMEPLFILVFPLLEVGWYKAQC